MINLSNKNWVNDLDGEFDMIIFFEVIEHLYTKDQENSIDSISKKLSKDAVLIVTCPNRKCVVKKIINFSKKVPYFGKKIKIELKGSLGYVTELLYTELRKMISYYFKKEGKGDLHLLMEIRY